MFDQRSFFLFILSLAVIFIFIDKLAKLASKFGQFESEKIKVIYLWRPSESNTVYRQEHIACEYSTKCLITNFNDISFINDALVINKKIFYSDYLNIANNKIVVYDSRLTRNKSSFEHICASKIMFGVDIILEPRIDTRTRIVEFTLKNSNEIELHKFYYLESWLNEKVFSLDDNNVDYKYYCPLCITLYDEELMNSTKRNNYNANGQNNNCPIGSQKYSFKVVPDIIHFILIEKEEIDFLFYLVLKAALKFDPLADIYIHTENKITGNYWWKLSNESFNVRIQQISIEVPKFVKNLKIPKYLYPWHFADFYRIVVLEKFGGTYLDTDHILLESLDKYRFYEFSAIVRKEFDDFSPAIITSAKHSKILKALKECIIDKYDPEIWGTFSLAYSCLVSRGISPNKSINHYETVFSEYNECGEPSLYWLFFSNEPITSWIAKPGVHLCRATIDGFQTISSYNVNYSFNEDFIQTYNSTFGQIARYILFDDEEIYPKIETVE